MRWFLNLGRGLSGLVLPPKGKRSNREKDTTMKLALAAAIFLTTGTAALADYSTTWAYNYKWDQSYTGVQITNKSNRWLSCNVRMRLQICQGWSCRTVNKQRDISVRPYDQNVAGYFKGGPVDYRTSCRYASFN